MSSDSKPHWKDAPEWAQYLAQDSTGDWQWHEAEPHLGCYTWCSIDRTQLVVDGPEDWKQTLEERP